MFTGIIEEVGTVRSLRKGPGGAVIRIAAQVVTEGIRIGDSLAVEGVCLTIVKCAQGELEADASLETLGRSTLGLLQPGYRVNLERALMPTGRLGGHIVQGHVDALGAWERLAPEGDGWRAYLRVPGEVARYVVDKGSIAVSGVSLTVASINGSTISVALIPHTIDRTTLKDLKPGDAVNLEADIIGKYVYKYTHPEEEMEEKDSGRFMNKLAEGGFI